MLYLCHGNQLEDLADRLVLDLARPVNSVLAPDLIAVPGQGISRWLSLRLAHQQGIIANILWQFPAELLWHLFRTVLPDVPATNAFSADALAWRVLSVLIDEEFVAAHPPLSHYLGSGDPQRRWQLSQRLGRLYEQYLVYRPDWIRNWQYQASENWQEALWRQLIDTGNDRHWLIAQEEMLRRLNSDPSVVKQLPERISLFALPTLSPAYLELLQAVSKHIDVTIYHQNFSRGYWTEIISEKEQARLVVADGEAANQYIETGNSLLATMGRQGREQLSGLLQLEALETEVFQSPPLNTLLGQIQSDIFELRERDDSQRFELKPDDNSLQLHCCHSIMREIEVAHDQLLGLFQTDHTLEPADVLVLVPEIDVFAPYVDAVFGAATGNRYIPWRLVGRGLADASPLVEAFLALLDLPFSRFEADKVIALLDRPALRRRFGLHENDTEQVRRWVRELGICWGIDTGDLAEREFSTGGRHTWRVGTDRLLLGHALGESGALFSGILPRAPSDGGEAQIVGRLRTFLEQLIELRADLEGSRTVVSWIEVANAILDRFFHVESDDETEVRRLREHLTAIAKVTDVAGYDSEVPLVVFRDALKARFSGITSGQFMTGAVTFASLAQGGCLPVRVMYLLGMNNEAFPGRETRHSFDQIKAYPRPGDRHWRDEDRHVFLEALLAARERLYISYVGRDVRDDSEKPPSVFISELLDCIDSMCNTRRNGPPSNILTIIHPLQAFSTRYFDNKDEKLFSYATDLIPPDRAQAMQCRPLLSSVLPPIESEDTTLETVAQFFANPARMLLRDRLGIFLERRDGQLPNREPVSLNFIARRTLAEAALHACLVGEPREVFAARWHASGKLPAGTPGDLLLAAVWQQVSGLVPRLMTLLPNVNSEPVIVDVMVDSIRLQTSLDNVTSEGLIGHSVGKPSPHDLLKFWLSHLALNMSGGVAGGSSRILTPNKTVTFRPVNNALEILADLVSLYREGMTQALAFFPRSAWAYVATTGDPETASARAWQGSEYKVGEGDNMYYALAFRDIWDDVLVGEFPKLAARVYGPLRDHLAEEERS
jgi:exodeoxyribonuclease V gamma subunit